MNDAGDDAAMSLTEWLRDQSARLTSHAYRLRAQLDQLDASMDALADSLIGIFGAEMADEIEEAMERGDADWSKGEAP